MCYAHAQSLFFCSINFMHLPITKYKHYAFSNHRYIHMSVKKKSFECCMMKAYSSVYFCPQ